jgi:phosphoribosylglycinamide formyltransferase 2
MVTLAGTQNFSEFELHARAILGLPIPEIKLLRNGASAVVLASNESNDFPVFTGLKEAAAYTDSDFKLFGKPTTRLYRRMGVALTYGDDPIENLVSKAIKVAKEISVK